MKKEKVAVIDRGGRGSALMEAYLRSPHVGGAIAIPGNDWMKRISEKPVSTFPQVGLTEASKIVSICKDQGVTLAEVPNERSVCAGVSDALRREGIAVVGPNAQAGIMIEGEKCESRAFGTRHGLPQPEYRVYRSDCEEEHAISYARTRPPGLFIKASGMCDGKGAFPAETHKQAEDIINGMINLPGNAGRRFLIEEWLKNPDGTNGEEFSGFCMMDSRTWKITGHAQDHKRLGEGDTGKNTGGMGCGTPPLVVTPEIQAQEKEIFEKVFAGLKEEGVQYNGILYLGGILINRKGGNRVYVVEFNARWGDPEAQVIIPGIKTDLFEIGKGIAENGLSGLEIKTDGKARISVAAVAKGYPDDYGPAIGKRIFGLERAADMKGVRIYGAGMEIIDGKFYVSGGRLFHIVGEGRDVLEAKERAYSAMARVFVEGNNWRFRTDIEWKDVDRWLLRPDAAT